MMNGPDLQILAHLPKTGGQTLVRVMQRQFRPQEVLSYEDHLWVEGIASFAARAAAGLDGIRCVVGHLPFGVRAVADRRVRYVTMLRDPLEWTLSLYSYIRGRVDRLPADPGELRPDDPRLPQRAAFAAVRGMSLEQFVDFMESSRMGNFQTRFVSGTMDVGQPLPPYAPLPATALAAAKSNLESPDNVFGLVERFDLSLLMFRRRLGWRNVFYRRVNVTADRTRLSQVREETVEHIRRLHALDLELYAWAERSFNEAIAANGLDRSEQLRQFQLANAAYGLAVRGVGRIRSALGA